MKNRKFSTVSAAALSSASIAAISVTMGSTALAQDTDDEIIVTATRRAETVQDIPINIAAVGGDQIEEQGLTELGDLLRYVPGINVVDRGGRQGNPIIVRGINASAVDANDGNNDGGGTVATYLGDIPVFVDLKLNDLERVEVLLGPQGTLYGSGTLGGAIRYIPKRPDFTRDELKLRGELYQFAEAGSLSTDVGVTVNKQITDNFALRGSFDFVSDSGFIDQPYLVQEVAVSDPDPNFFDPADVAANLVSANDTNGEEVYSARVAARWAPTEWLDGTLTYYFQESFIEGRSISHFETGLPVGRYDNALRVREPNRIQNDLLALEVTADLGFAELTSATGFSTFEAEGQRDQTDLLITLEFSYETFPTFTSFTRELDEAERFNQEIRLVSKHEGPFSWIIGGFWNELDEVGSSSEFTPLYAEFAGLVNRPDDLEFFSFSRDSLVERAVFGEVAYEFFDRLTITLGGRYYDYEVESVSAQFFPLFGDDFDGDGDPTTFGPPPTLDELNQTAFDPALNFSEDGFLFKINASYQITDDFLAYFTVSEGFRVGESNGLPICSDTDLTDISNNVQNQCGLVPGQVITIAGQQVTNSRNETAFSADTTRNYEVGAKTSWLDGALVLNGALFWVQWMDPQLDATSIGALLPITVNAEGARSIGAELSGAWQVTDRARLRGSFSYTDSQLTAVAPNLVGTISPPGFGPVLVDGEDGDRLPGSPQTQFSVFGTYDLPLPTGKDLVLNLGYAWQGDVLTTTGSRGNGFVLDSFGTADFSATYNAGPWSASFFVDNIFNTFGATGVRDNPLFNQVLTDSAGGDVNVRRFYRDIIAPRSIGIRFTYDFVRDK